MKGSRLPYEKEGVYILARNSAKRPEYHIAKIISVGEISNPTSGGNASTKCLRYYKSHEYLIAEKEPQRDEICRKCQSMRHAGGRNLCQSRGNPAVQVKEGDLLRHTTSIECRFSLK